MKYVYEGVTVWSGYITGWHIGEVGRFQLQSPEIRVEGRTPLCVHLSSQEPFVIALMTSDAGSELVVALNRTKTEGDEAVAEKVANMIMDAAGGKGP